MAAQLRINRRNSAKQAQLKKRQSLVSATRIFSGLDGAPRVVAIVPLTEDVKARDVSKQLAAAIDGTLEEDSTSGLQKLRYVHPSVLRVYPPEVGDAEQTGSRLPFSSSLSRTSSCMQLWTHAKSRTTSSLPSRPMSRLTSGAIRFSAPYRRKAFQRSSR